MEPIKIAENIYSVGVNDWNIRDFHGYSTHLGTSYNAFLILDEKNVLIDTVKEGFAKELLGDVAVDIAASQSREQAAGELRLPLLEPLKVTRERGLVAVIAPESLEVKTDSAGLRAALAATPADLASKGFRPEVPGGSTLAAAFSFVTRPVSIVQTITERPRRMFVVAGTAANVKEDVVQVATTFCYQIQFAGTVE